MPLSACNVQRKGCFDATQSDDPVQSNDPDAAFTASSFDHKDSREATCLLCLRPAVSPVRMGSVFIIYVYWYCYGYCYLYYDWSYYE